MLAHKTMAVSKDNPELLQELLADLQHDLGKYLRMPLSFLPPDAPYEDVHKALRKALLCTRETPNGVRSARGIWTAFCADARPALEDQPLFVELERAVARALLWEDAAQAPPAPLPRPALEADLQAVTPAIRALLNALRAN